jgi:CBS domain containing-hemolysin-like protein
LIKILYPLIVAIEWLMKGLNRKEKKNAISESDLEAFIDLSKQSGIFDHDQDKKIKRLLALDELTAEDIMTPRIKIKALDDDISLDEAIQELTDLHFSRIPVYHESIDTIDRIVTLKELLRFRRKIKGSTLLADLKLAPISKIPRSQPIDTLLEKFQKTHKHIAVVVDEYGGVE